MKNIFACVLLLAAASACIGDAKPKLNILIITVDDMGCDSVGAFGCKLADTTPSIDALATRGLRFDHAHVQVGNCMPGRNVMWSGCYPHNNGVEGFYQVRPARRPHLVDVMNDAGYFTAIRGKVAHSTPYQPYAWGLDLSKLPDGSRAHMKDAKSYGTSTKQAIDAAKAAGKPFCLMVNISDPHKPFYAQNNKTGATIPDPHVPSRVFEADEVPIPGFLFDDPVVRKELAHYYSSVRRADDCVRETLRALDESGEAKSTAIVFLSDHGMPLPFAKTQLYHHSTRTPLIVVWPGVTKANLVDRTNMVSAVDLMPTILDIAGAEHPAGMDGKSFAPLIHGEMQVGRDMVFKEFNESASRSRDPMRGVQTKRYLYLFNPWSNGERIMTTATRGTPTNRRMKELARTDAYLAKRVALIEHRVPEELYDVANDPDCLNNLIDDPDMTKTANGLRKSLEQWMVDTGDPMLETFRKRDDPEARETFVRKQEAESAARGGKNQKNRNRAKAGQ